MITKSPRPMISVIIPVLNNVVGLKRCLDSVFRQPLNAVDVIVIDGGSTDGTLDVIAAFESQISYWETGKDKGIADSFNRGIKRASTDFIAILNSDDYWVADYTRSFLDVLTPDSDVDVFYGNARYFDPVTDRSYVRIADISKMHKRMYLFHPAIIVRKAAYERIGSYSLDYHYAMDSEWCHRAISQKLKFQKIDATLAVISLGGLSDKNYKLALMEYRSSLIANNLSNQYTVSSPIILCQFL